MFCCLVGAALVILSTGCVTTSNAPNARPGTEVPPGQDAKLVAYNVALGAVAGGLGALINGEKDSALRRFARGAGWGAAGGSIAYLGKWQAGEIDERENLAHALPARLLHDVGASVIENAAHDLHPLDRFATTLGVIRVDVRPRSGAVQARLLPVATLAFGYLLLDGTHNLDLGRSLACGGPLFTADEIRPPFGESGRFAGYVFFGSVIVRRQDDGVDYDIAAHELVHVAQLNEMARIESAFRAPLDAPLRASATYRGLARYVYLDSPALFVLGYYGVSGGVNSSECYFNNWFEREAEAFGERRPLGVCP